MDLSLLLAVIAVIGCFVGMIVAAVMKKPDSSNAFALGLAISIVVTVYWSVAS